MIERAPWVTPRRLLSAPLSLHVETGDVLFRRLGKLTERQAPYYLSSGLAAEQSGLSERHSHHTHKARHTESETNQSMDNLH